MPSRQAEPYGAADGSPTDPAGEQPKGTALHAGGLRQRVRGWFTPTGTPPAWGLVRYLVAGLVVGAALTALLPDSGRRSWER